MQSVSSRYILKKKKLRISVGTKNWNVAIPTNSPYEDKMLVPTNLKAFLRPKMWF